MVNLISMYRLWSRF
ncbi:hypothetical protein F383_29868 [Gossypium arboreum]|uniref:Uncharacterized protein n=1 Tax=Gossypium arboreum TaxID=29729 RepID=A0A0B0PG91_GOSAR|nr:hypothetical protein F383_29868 [Gossypium arboreum]